ncbi:MAG: hypothetical protein DMF59_06645 [Acidobacteria bacterium]|nr:MAG: hypothetical protein DMF59_06645 [Acidobacteriota bacterium]
MSDYWSLTSAALHGQPWRLWTGHIVHFGPSSFFPESLAMVPPLMLLHPKHRMRTIVWGLVIAPLISLAILASVPNAEFRGSSALAVTIWILAPLLYFNHHPYSDRRVPPAPAYVFLTFCGVKLIVETFSSFGTPTLAHWLGVVAAAMTFIFLRAKIVHTAIRQFSESRSALSERVC